MCDKEHFDALERRVDEHDSRLTAVETSLTDFRAENRRGFDSIGKQLDQIYGEKAKWSEWLRAHIGKFLKWLGAFVTLVCGLEKLPEFLARLNF